MTRYNRDFVSHPIRYKNFVQYFVAPDLPPQQTPSPMIHLVDNLSSKLFRKKTRI